MSRQGWTDSEHERRVLPRALNREHIGFTNLPADAEVAGHLMRTDFPAVRPTTSVVAVRALMRQHHLDLLPMVEADGRLLGVVLDRDLGGAPGVGAVAGPTLAAELARHDIPCVAYQQPISCVVEEMAAHEVSALPVVIPGKYGEYVEGLIVLEDVPTPRERTHVLARAIRVRAKRFLTQTRQLLLRAGRFMPPIPTLLAGLSVVLAVLWMFHSTLRGPVWLSCVDLTAAIVAFVGAATWREPQMVGVALSAFLSMTLVVLFLFCRLIGLSPWLTWGHLALAGCFLALTVAAAVEPDGLRVAGAR